LRALLPRPRIGDRVTLCLASADSARRGEAGVVTADDGALGLTVRLESGKGRRYREEELLLQDGAFSSAISSSISSTTSQVARLTRMEVEQRGCVGRLAAQHRAMEAAVQRFSPLPPTFSRPPPSTPSPIGAEPDPPPPAPAPVLDDCQSTHGSLPTCREPDNPEAAKLRAELDHLLRWLGDWSHGVATRISAQARSLEALSMDLACLAAVPSCAERQQRVSPLGNVLRDVQRVKGRADGALGVL